jgi:hypothetical protein
LTRVSYHLRGTFLEACDCKTLCPCWVGQAPDQNVCNGLFVWSVDGGETNMLDGHPAQGLRVASVSHHEGTRASGSANQKVAIFVDVPPDAPAESQEWVTDPERLRTVVETFAGNRGGPLAGLGALLGELVNVPDDVNGEELRRRVRRTITLDVSDSSPRYQVSVTDPEGAEPELVRVESDPLLSEDQVNNIQMTYSALSTSLGNPATVGQAARMSLYVPGFAPEFWLDIDLQDRSATTGAFAYDAS